MAGLHSSEGFWGEICFLAFSSLWVLPAFLGPWLPSIFKTSNGLSSLSHGYSTVPLTLLPASSTCKVELGACDYTDQDDPAYLYFKLS